MLRVLTAVALLCLAACNIQYKNPSTERQALRDGTPCCAELSQLKYEALPVGGPTEILIEKTDQIFDFGPPFGRSYVRAFVLPTDYQDLWFRIRSYIVKPGLLEDGGFFVPQLTLLDSDYRIVGLSDPRRFVHIESTLLDEPMEPARIALFARSRAELIPRFLLIHTTEPMMNAGGSRQVTTGGSLIAVPGGGFVALPSTSRYRDFIGFPTGRVKLWLGTGEPADMRP